MSLYLIHADKYFKDPMLLNFLGFLETFWEQCRSIKFGPNVIFTMLLGPISLGGHDPGSLTLVQGHPKKSGNWSCVSFGEECTCLLLKSIIFLIQKHKTTNNPSYGMEPSSTCVECNSLKNATGNPRAKCLMHLQRQPNRGKIFTTWRLF